MTEYRGTMSSNRADLEVRVAAFEAACGSEWPVDPARFAPPPGHPDHLETLCELVRVHLEVGWGRGTPTPLSEYQSRFPALFARPDLAAAVRFEDGRLRDQIGRRTLPGGELAARTEVVPDATPLPRRPVKKPADSGWSGSMGFLERAAPTLPKAGSTFHGFHLLEELGAGSFGRVYLARQKALSDRPVALKLTTRPNPEAQYLARLQHTNIMPVLSVHEADGVQAVCMPFLGRITLGHVLRSLGQGRGVPRSGRSLVSELRTVASRHASVRSRVGTSRTLLAGGASGPADPLAGTEPGASVSGGPDCTPTTDQPVSGEDRAPYRDMLSGMSFVDAVVWLGARLADGLAHAHERGVLHRDLKPENVLLADDGQPMLLDFNLAEDTAPATPNRVVGGTVLYMAPEHLAVFAGERGRKIDERSDLYALGLILYELLAGRHPYPLPDDRTSLLATMRAARERKPVSVRAWNPAVPAAVDAVVCHLLDPNPDRRYQTARALAEDLDRQLSHQPLLHAREPVGSRVRKWLRRHPRSVPLAGMMLAVWAAVGLATFTGVNLVARAHEQAAGERAQFRDELRNAQVLLVANAGDPANRTAGADTLRAALARYAAADDPDWHTRPAVTRLSEDERAGLRADVGEALLLLARATAADDPAAAVELNRRAEEQFPPDRVPAAVWRQRADLCRRAGDEAGAKDAASRAAGADDSTAQAAYLDGTDRAIAGEFAEAIPPLERACALDPAHPAATFTLAFCLENVGRNAEALECYRACIALRPTFPWPYLNRGTLHMKLGRDDKALADLDAAVRLKPDWADAVFTRGTLHQRAERWAEAKADYDAAERLGCGRSRLLLLRGEVKWKLNDPTAGDDRRAGFAARPTDQHDLLARGVARLPLEPHLAVAEFDTALALYPRSLPALQNKAHVLAEYDHDPAAAAAVLDDVVRFYPDYVPGRASRAVLLARQGKRAEAHRDAEECRRRDGSAVILYQLAGVYAHTAPNHPEDLREAVRLLAAAFTSGFRDFPTLDTDPDLDPIRATPEFKAVVREFRPSATHPEK